MKLNEQQQLVFDCQDDLRFVVVGRRWGKDTLVNEVIKAHDGKILYVVPNYEMRPEKFENVNAINATYLNTLIKRNSVENTNKSRMRVKGYSLIILNETDLMEERVLNLIMEETHTKILALGTPTTGSFMQSIFNRIDLVRIRLNDPDWEPPVSWRVGEWTTFHFPGLSRYWEGKTPKHLLPNYDTEIEGLFE